MAHAVGGAHLDDACAFDPGGGAVNPVSMHYAVLTPEYILAAAGGLVLLVDAFRGELKVGRNLLPWIAVVGAGAAAAASLAWINARTDFAGIVAVDNYTTF